VEYAKPEAVIIGNAWHVINFLLIKGQFSLMDIMLLRINPAYDLDD
jgi:hypothetical protein